MNFTLKKGFKLNPNKKLVEAITKRIELCNGYCPCDNPDKGTEDAKCPCKSYRERGECHCTLYVKE